ncbi:MAG: 6-carboxytetrahydropterin synthase [Ferruginibacter sp.]|nr:6-carboxytetrahydropterin synthase [Ferruginibacter sp.]
MLSVTKIFHFEMAHAIHGYYGACKNIHGHSYELRVTVSSVYNNDDYIPAPGFVADFKEIKNIVTALVIDKLDHHLLLSKKFLEANSTITAANNLLVFEAEPSAENLLLYIKGILQEQLPEHIHLSRLKLFETKDSYAEWVSNNLFVY